MRENEAPICSCFILQPSFQLQVLPRSWLVEIKAIGTFHALFVVATSSDPEKYGIRWRPIVMVRGIRLRTGNIKAISDIELTPTPRNASYHSFVFSSCQQHHIIHLHVQRSHELRLLLLAKKFCKQRLQASIRPADHVHDLLMQDQ